MLFHELRLFVLQLYVVVFNGRALTGAALRNCYCCCIVESTDHQVVRSEWLSECLRLRSLQPFESHLLDTITLSTVSKFAKRNTATVAATARSAAGGTSL